MTTSTRTRRIRMTGVAVAAFAALSTGVLTACGSSDTATASADTPATTQIAAPTAQEELYAGMRTLWAEHMDWTWNVVVAFTEESPLLDDSIDRLLANQSHIGDAVAGFYGTEAGDALTVLLEEHITDAVPVLTAAKAGDEAALDTAVADWYDNAERIADFLAEANPHWNAEDMREMMAGHITQTIAYASALLGGDYAQAIVDYGEAADHMAMMADDLSAGIIAQFPEDF